MRCIAVIIRLMDERDYEPFRGLFEEAYAEYLEFLKVKNPQRYQKERKIRREVSPARFNHYLETGSSFVAEEDGKFIGYVASQAVSFMHGVDKLLWIEYIVVQSGHRRKGVGTALLNRLIDYAKSVNIDRIYTTINPDNEASIKLHRNVGFNVEDRKVASLRIQAL